MNYVEQLYRLPSLVRLKPTDATQLNVGRAREKGRPFLERLLNPAFAKVLGPGRPQQLIDRLN